MKISLKYSIIKETLHFKINNILKKLQKNVLIPPTKKNLEFNLINALKYC